MAEELFVSVELDFSKKNSKPVKVSESIKVDVTGTEALENIQSVGTSEEAILLGDVTVGGYMYLENVESEGGNYVEIRPNTGVADLIRLEPGQVALFPTAQDAVPYAIANTAAVRLRVAIIDL